MSEHYYTENPQSAHDERLIEVRALGNVLRFTTDAGVFSRDGLDRGTEVLLNALPELKGRGAVGVALGAKCPGLEIVMTDVNARAVELSRRNLALNGVRAEILQGDGFVPMTGTFDAIVTNPPIRAGKAVIYGLFDRARDFLNPGGRLYVVIRKQQGASSALKHLKERYKTAEVIDRGGGFWVIEASVE